MIWCEHCRDHYDEDHYDEEGLHKVGEQYGVVGRGIARTQALEDALLEYADHQSWRCEYPDRYPWNPDCPCGLISTLDKLDIPGPETPGWRARIK